MESFNSLTFLHRYHKFSVVDVYIISALMEPFAKEYTLNMYVDALETEIPYLLN